MSADAAARAGRPEIVPRNPRFGTGERANPYWHGGDVARTAMWDAFSLLLPVGERFFVRSVRHYRPLVEDPVLQREVEGFLAQEAAHSREHQTCNAGLARLGLDVAHLEAPVAEALGWAEKHCTPLVQLAVTSALEHVTAIMADAVLRDPVFLDGADPEFADLWRWHAIEETEHKAVAFDVLSLAMRHRSPLARYRLRAWIFIKATMLVNFVWVVNVNRLLAGRPRATRLGDWLKIGWNLWGWPGLYRRSLVNYCRYLLPGFHPWRVDNSRLLEEWRDRLAYQGSVPS